MHAWAIEGDHDPTVPMPASTFEMEWPPHSGKRRKFPELDRLEFYDLDEARRKLKDTHLPFLDRLEAALKRC